MKQCFFNLDCGDRLGHAIALGINVEEWYRTKGNRILISKQDYLDNIVWMHGRIVELGVNGQEELKDYLQKEFSLYFKEIYENYIDFETVRIILKKWKKNIESMRICCHMELKSIILVLIFTHIIGRGN